MSGDDYVAMVHPGTTVHAKIRAHMVPGWRRLGWVPVDDVAPAATDESPGDEVALHGEDGLYRAATPDEEPITKLPADVPGITDGLAAGSSSDETEGEQP